MERTKLNDNQKIQLISARIQSLGAISNRLSMAYNLGQSYSGVRDIYEALGYSKTLSWADYYGQYTRQDMAKAIIDRPIRATWRGDLKLVEVNDDEETKFEKAWNDLEKELKLKQKFIRLDKLTGLGRYGVLLLGLDDVKRREDYAIPTTGTRKLLYVMPFGENSAVIDEWENDPGSPRYGMPKIYKVTTSDPEGTRESELLVHYSRVIHIVEDPLENDIYGTPRLEVVFNRLKDMEKVIGASAEMYWRGGRPGYDAKVDPDYKLSDTAIDDFIDQLTEYENNLRRVLVNEGFDIKSLQQQFSDPKGQVDVIVQMVSMVTGIPKRILTGSERGELSSAQDKDEWLTWVKTRREEFAEPIVIRTFVERCIQLGILPKTQEDSYTVQWEDLFSMSDKEKAEIGRVRAEALRSYVTQPAEHIIPPDAFLTHFLGLDEDTVTLIQEQLEAIQAEEPVITPEEQRMLDEQRMQQQLPQNRPQNQPQNRRTA